MSKTLVGVFDSQSEAQQVREDLLGAGFSSNDITVQSSEHLRSDADSVGTTAHLGSSSNVSGTNAALGTNDSSYRDSSYPRTDTSSAYSDDSRGFGSGIAHFFRSLFGSDEDEHAGYYSEALRRGSYMVSVDASTDDEADRAEQIMQRHNAIDIDERAAHWRSRGWTGYDAGAPALSSNEVEEERRYSTAAMGNVAMGTTGSTISGAADTTKIPVVEEELKVGKREVQRGGVRVYTRVTERPIEETVHLREERATIERHAVDRPASEADLATFKEGTIEVRESVEEAVVSKSARVVEEVEVGREVTEHDETVRDTIRKTDVQVERLSDDQSVSSKTRTTGTTDTTGTRKTGQTK